MEWAKYLGVALTAMSPVGEELIAIPLGVGLGLPALLVAALALPCNYIPALVISALFKAGERKPRVVRWLQRLRRERVRRILDRYGLIGVILVTPWVGVYATVTTLELLGMDRRRLHLTVLSSLVLYAIGVTLAAHFGIGWFRRGS